MLSGFGFHPSLIKLQALQQSCREWPCVVNSASAMPFYSPGYHIGEINLNEIKHYAKSSPLSLSFLRGARKDPVASLSKLQWEEWLK